MVCHLCILTVLTSFAATRGVSAPCHRIDGPVTGSPIMHFPSGTCHLITDPSACGSSWAGKTVDGDCSSAGYTHECMGHYDIGVWFKTEDCGGCMSEEGMGKDGQPCPKKEQNASTSEPIHATFATLKNADNVMDKTGTSSPVSAPCHRIDGPVTDSPIMHFPSGSCHLITDPSACGSSWAGKTVDGDCSSAGYTHECLGQYDIGVWFKTEDCGGCMSEEGMGKDGQPCPKKERNASTSKAQNVRRPTMKNDEMEDVSTTVAPVSAPCHRIDGPVTDSPIMHFPSGTCHLITDPSACGSSWAGKTVDGDCSSVGYTHECLGHYGIGVWFKTEDCGGCMSEGGMGKDGQPCPPKQDTVMI